MNNKYTVGDLFAGAGGLSKAFEQAGAKVIWANDVDKNACQLYKENFNDVCLVEGDIKDIDVEEIPKIDILLGGLPYQYFSVKDNQSQNLFFEIIRILKIKKPRAFLLESTKGLISHDNGKTFKSIMELLQNQGYFVKSEALNSIEHGNIPHSRELVYIVGFRREEEDKLFEFPKKIELKLKVNDFLDTNEEKAEKYYCKNLKYYQRYYSKFREFITRKDMVYQLNTVFKNNERVQVLKEYNYCCTLSRYSSPLINDGFDVRKLTPNEWFKFRGFSKIKISSSVSETELYNLATICSSITVAERIARNIIEAMDLKEFLRDNEINLNTVCEFKYHRSTLYEFVENCKLSRRINLSKFNIDKENKLTDYQQKMTIGNQLIKEGESSSKIGDKEFETNRLIEELSRIKHGKDHAYIFHKYIAKALGVIFEKDLSRVRCEMKMDEGRKRPDIIFDNSATNGFFYELNKKYDIKCRQIVIECKNYSSTPSNKEVDQLLGRFNSYIGNFGILICRKIKNKTSLISRCKDAMNKGQGHVIVLCDKDILNLLKLKKINDEIGINNYMRGSFDELII